MVPSVQKGQFIWFHQITGASLFCGIAPRLLWKFYNLPVFEDNLLKRLRIGSKILQMLLYLICVFLPIQGSMMTWAGRFDVYLVGVIKLPVLIAENKAMYPSFASIHLAPSFLLLTLSPMHMAARLISPKFWLFFCFGAIAASISGVSVLAAFWSEIGVVAL